jgi:hypothetical protein
MYVAYYAPVMRASRDRSTRTEHQIKTKRSYMSRNTSKEVLPVYAMLGRFETEAGTLGVDTVGQVRHVTADRRTVKPGGDCLDVRCEATDANISACILGAWQRSSPYRI